MGGGARPDASNWAATSPSGAWADPLAPADMTITTSAMARVLQYEPRDLTISVEAGISYRELSRLLAEHRQMIPLDPPFADTATIGGIVACNSSGPRRRLYGTARDLVIGMSSPRSKASWSNRAAWW